MFISLAYLFFEDDVLVLELLHDGRLSLTNGPDFEEAIHLVERNGFGLGNEEPHKDKRSGGDTAEEEVHAATGWAHTINHVGGDAGDDEGP